jgi:hypothetical protein
MTHYDNPFSAGVASHLDTTGKVMSAEIKIVGLPVSHAQEAHSPPSPLLAEMVIQAVTRAKQSAHRSAACHDRGRLSHTGLLWLVPKHTQKTAHRVRLSMPKSRRHLDLARSERVKSLEGRRGDRIYWSVRSAAICHRWLAYKRTCPGKRADQPLSISGIPSIESMPV